MNSLMPKTFVVFDLETTGLYHEKGARICEIGAVRYEGETEVETFHSMVNPQVPIEPEASRVNGIYDIDVAMAPLIEEVIDSFLAFLGDDPLLGYKVSFDLGFVNNELVRLRYQELSNKFFDVLLMTRELLPGLSAYNLSAVAKHLKIDTGKAHRAIDDARTTANVFLVLAQKIANYRELSWITLYEKYGYCTHGSTVACSKWDSILKKAIVAKSRLSIEYRSKKGEITQRELFPFRIEKRGYEYFLVAKCALRNDMRSFNLKQIVNCRIL